MARINSNLGSLNAIQNFARVNQELNQVIARLSSGQAINSAADNPAGLIISEQLRGAIEGLSARIQSAERTGNALTTAEDALGQISNILVDVRANTVALANDAALPPEARQALQSQVDMSLEAINRIAASTEFGGRPLLNGEFTAAIGDAEIQVGLVNAANIGGENPDETLATIGTGGVNSAFENAAAAAAAEVIDQAIRDIAERRGEIGAFITQQIGPAIEEFSVALENLAAADSAVRDADFALESANLARLQLLQDGAGSVAATANSTNEAVLRLLGG